MGSWKRRQWGCDVKHGQERPQGMHIPSMYFSSSCLQALNNLLGTGYLVVIKANLVLCPLGNHLEGENRQQG